MLAAAAAAASPELQVEPWMKSLRLGEEELEERLCACLEAVELEYLLGRWVGGGGGGGREEVAGGGGPSFSLERVLFVSGWEGCGMRGVCGVECGLGWNSGS